MTDLEWKRYGNCAGKQTNIWYPDNAAGLIAPRAICEDCPVTSECLDHALRHEKYGVWAGTSERQREELRRRRHITVVPWSTTPVRAMA